MLERLAKNHLLILLVCVLSVVEISRAQRRNRAVGELGTVGTLRSSKTISTPGQGGSLSGGGGIGNLYSAPQGAGVLSTSINRAPQHNILRKNTGISNSNTMRSNISLSSGSTHKRIDRNTNIPSATNTSKIPRATPGRGGPTTIKRRTSSSVGTMPEGGGVFKTRGSTAGEKPSLLGNFAGATYVASIEHESAIQKELPEEEITTLVPKNPGFYQKKMLAAEIAFKNREFRDALANYDLATGLSNNSPESLLGIMHTYFASSTTDYAMTALYLRSTLERFPELPLANINLKAFYLDPIQYRRDLTRLEKYVKRNPKNANAQLVLGYFLWREGEIKNSKKALNMALTYSKQKELDEAIDTLWSGMVATGKVSGKLQKIAPKKTKPQEDKKTTPPSETDKSE